MSTTSIAYFSDLDLSPAGGGSYAVNWHCFEQLKRHFDRVTPHKITPQVSAMEQRWSQFQRKVLRRPGKFAYFSPKVLDANARQVEAKSSKTDDAIFFRSATRWCRSTPDGPYFVYLDVVFHTFFFNTFDPADFDQRDLERIWAEEAAFLENAAGVYFESQWGLDRAREAYQLRAQHYEAFGRGGVLPPPSKDSWDGESLSLVTIAMKFEQKGGDILFEAFKELRKRHPALRWHIIGGEPATDDWRAFPEITYEGKLRPDHPDELKRFEEILGSAFLLVHVTREDTSPLVLTEAAYFGCPSISVRKFGIPGLIADGETGILLDPPVAAESLGQTIEALIEDRGRYQHMREQARTRALETSTWEAVGSQMAAHMKARINQ
ncbi:glycosyltransferase family 4 protein [Cerasicoccus maritimus]|uniref:glycosyltransferase family 4 protein n=1 Tax=Cerasicoccus maritimus TaxID=490089 RepID=UPI002852BBDB|nr:glycosyltransferase family 4 protein [Cerasicoccus maritimus]